MASRCSRFITRTSLSSLKSAIRSSSHSSSSPKLSPPSFSSVRSIPKFNISRIPSELGCVQSLLPLHSAVATARMTSCLSATTSRSCRALLQGT